MTAQVRRKRQAPDNLFEATPPVTTTDIPYPLHDAAQTGATETCLRLLTTGADPTGRVGVPHSVDAAGTPHAPGSAPLHLAAGAGHAEACKILIAHGAYVDIRDGLLATPLHFAAAAGSDPVCRLLIDAGADVLSREVGGETALHLAARCGHGPTCEVLLAAGADVLAVDLSGASPLHGAAGSHHAAVCSALLAAGAQVTQEDEVGHHPLHLAVHHALESRTALSAVAKTFLTLLRAGADDQVLFPLSRRSITATLSAAPRLQERYLAIRAKLQAERLTATWGGAVMPRARRLRL